ncbi:MAG: S8 family serine peptidase [Acidimicrobiia bacterium]
MVHIRRGMAVLVLGAAVALAPGTGPAGAQSGDDPVRAQGLQWALERIGAEAAWERARGEGITIAVVDSGVDLDHEDLVGQVVGHVSCIGADGDPRRCRGSGQDDNGHGTHVAGIAAAATGNGKGVAAVAPDARILAVRVLADSCGGDGCQPEGTAADVAAGIRWATANGADVINLSLGGGAIQSALGCAFCDAIEEAWAAGVISVVAAGNDAILPAGFGSTPAVVVTATTRDDARASYSNRNDSILEGARWPVAAPGGEPEADPDDCGTGRDPRGIVSTYLDDGPGGYACLAGTSMAAPHVSGALALLRSAGLDPQKSIDRLLATATDLGPPGRDSTYGWGRIDLARALDRLTAASSGGPGAGTSSPPTTATSPTTAVPTPMDAGEVPTTLSPEVVTPEPQQAAPFSPAPPATAPSPAEPVPGSLVAVAMAAIAATALGTSAAAWRTFRGG